MEQDNSDSNLSLYYVGKITLISVAYFLANLIILLLFANHNLISLIRPQVGVALAVLLWLGFDALPGILIGSFLIMVATGSPIDFAVIAAVENALAALLPAYYIQSKDNFSFELENAGSILGIMLLGVLIGPVISATVNLVGMVLIQIDMGENLLLVWGTKWLRDALGVLLFAPFFLVWCGNPLPKAGDKLQREEIAVYFSAAILAFLIFFGNLNQEAAYAIIFLIIPLIIWASIQLPIHGLVSINLMFSLLFLRGIENQEGAVFSGRLFSFPTFFFVLATLWVTSLILSSSIRRNQKAQNSLLDLTNRDKLTNLYNRLFFDTELKRLEKSRQFPISIIMCDMDNLKEVNDSFGHDTGDQLLKGVALLFALSFRLEDIIARIGGDEFVILLPNTDALETKNIIDRMKNRIDAYNTKHPELPIRISFGVSTAEQGDSLYSHLKIADDLMYAEKARKKVEGRN